MAKGGKDVVSQFLSNETRYQNTRTRVDNNKIITDNFSISGDVISIPGDSTHSSKHMKVEGKLESSDHIISTTNVTAFGTNTI